MPIDQTVAPARKAALTGTSIWQVLSLRENTEALLKQLDLDLPTYFDPSDATRDAVDRVIGFQGFPTTLLLDRRGVIRAIWVGYRPGSTS